MVTQVAYLQNIKEHESLLQYNLLTDAMVSP